MGSLRACEAISGGGWNPCNLRNLRICHLIPIGYHILMRSHRKALVSSVLLAGLVLGTCLPSFAVGVTFRGGMVGGDRMAGLSFGVDYLHEQRDRRPVVFSLDEVVNVVGIFDIFAESPPPVGSYTALIVSTPPSARSPVFFGGGAVLLNRRDAGANVQPAARLTFSTGFHRLLLAQLRITAAPKLGVVGEISTGIGF